MSILRRVRHMGMAIALTASVGACASGGGVSGGDFVAPDFNFSATRSVHLDTPVQLAVTGGSAEMARVTEQELRDFLRQDLGVASANAAAADLILRFELTEWEAGATGSRVGGIAELVRPSDGVVVYRASSTYPNRFGTPAPGAPRDLMPDLFRALFGALTD